MNTLQIYDNFLIFAKFMQKKISLNETKICKYYWYWSCFCGDERAGMGKMGV
jgi:hypothetical protein